MIGVNIAGDFIGLAEPESVEIRFQADNGQRYDLKRGQSVQDVPRFQKLNIHNDSASSVEIEVYIGFGKINDNRLVGSVSLAPNAGFAGMSEITFDASAGTVAANANRVRLYMFAPTGNANSVWIGGTASGTGIELLPGSSFWIDTSAAVDYKGTSGEKLQLAEVTG